MLQSMYRNKNRDKTLIDYDLNIYMPEELDAGGESYWDPASWCIHVYTYNEGNSQEYSNDPIRLTGEEIVALGLNQDEYFRTEVDTWYGLHGFKLEYWDKMSDRLKQYFDELPKYWEDVV